MTSKEFLAILALDPPPPMESVDLTDEWSVISDEVRNFHAGTIRALNIELSRRWFKTPRVLNGNIGTLTARCVELRGASVCGLACNVFSLERPARLLIVNSELTECSTVHFSADDLVVSNSKIFRARIDGARVEKGQFDTCNFRDCRLAGTFKGCNFVDCTFENVHMQDAVFEDCAFFHRGRYQGIGELPQLPDCEGNFLCDSLTLSGKLAELADQLSENSRKWCQNLVHIWQKKLNHSVCLVDRSMFATGMTDADVRRIMKELYALRLPGEKTGTGRKTGMKTGTESF